VEAEARSAAREMSFVRSGETLVRRESGRGAGAGVGMVVEDVVEEGSSVMRGRPAKARGADSLERRDSKVL
jgi:hypothetical protein